VNVQTRSVARLHAVGALLLLSSFVPGISSAQTVGSHEACRGGSLLGGGFDAATGLYDWTCATEHTNWHGSVDPSQADASYLVSCTGPGSPHPTCLGTEDRMIGAAHQIGMAAARTRPGGQVYVPNFSGKPYAIWVDDGCGTLSDGTTRAKCPPAYTPQWRHLPHFDQSGPHARGDRVQANRGVQIIAEGDPSAAQNPAGEWVLQGGWLVADTGNTESRKGPGPVELDGEDADFLIDTFRFVAGGSKWGRHCHNSDDTSLACDTKGRAGVEWRWSGEDVWISGAVSGIVEDYDASSSADVCLANKITSSPLTTMGTCRGDRRYLCWDANGNGNTDENRSDGSCRWTGTTPVVDLGPCDGFVDALKHDLPSDPEIRLVFRVSQCTQPPQSSLHCRSSHGHMSYIVAIDDVPAAACANSGRTVTLDVSSGAPAALPSFAEGGTPNDVFVTRASLYEQSDGGFYNFGFMPGNYFGQIHSADVRFSGTTISQGDTAVLEFPTSSWTPNEWQGLTAVIDPTGTHDGPLYQTIESNTSSSLTLTMTTNDDHCAPEPCTESQNAGLVTPGDVVEIRGGMCSGSFHGAGKGTSDETVCDQTVLTGNFAARNAGFYNSLHFLCSTPNGGPACLDSNSLNTATGRYWNGRVWRAPRGFIADMSGDHMWNYSFRETNAGTVLSNFASYGLNEDISFIDNHFRTALILVGGQNVRGATYRNILMQNNVGGGTYEVTILTPHDLTMENIQSFGGRRSTFMAIEPRPFGPDPDTSDASQIILRDLKAVGELGERFTSSPRTAIFVNVNSVGTDTESIDGLWIENADFEGSGSDQCGIWLEDNHSPGPVLPQMEESRPSMAFRNILVSGDSGESRAICSGDSRGPGSEDSTSSAATFLETYQPKLENEWHLRGRASGGSIQFEVDSVEIEVATQSGQSAADVASAIVAEIANHPQLTMLGVDASAAGRTIVTNALIAEVEVNDPGLASTVGAPLPVAVPTVGLAGSVLLVAALICLGGSSLVTARYLVQ
jgi:hypothetical protein